MTNFMKFALPHRDSNHSVYPDGVLSAAAARGVREYRRSLATICVGSFEEGNFEQAKLAISSATRFSSPSRLQSVASRIATGHRNARIAAESYATRG